MSVRLIRKFLPSVVAIVAGLAEVLYESCKVLDKMAQVPLVTIPPSVTMASNTVPVEQERSTPPVKLVGILPLLLSCSSLFGPLKVLPWSVTLSLSRKSFKVPLVILSAFISVIWLPFPIKFLAVKSPSTVKFF